MQGIKRDLFDKIMYNAGVTCTWLVFLESFSPRLRISSIFGGFVQDHTILDIVPYQITSLSFVDVNTVQHIDPLHVRINNVRIKIIIQ